MAEGEKLTGGILNNPIRIGEADPPALVVPFNALAAAVRQAVVEQTVEQFTAALLTGLDDLERDDHHGTLVRPGDVADLVHRVAAEVGR